RHGPRTGRRARDGHPQRERGAVAPGVARRNPWIGYLAMRLAFLGPAGTFGEEAALRYAPDATLVPFASHAAVAAAVDSGEADEGVVAIENFLNGSVAETLDILIHETTLRIQYELVLPIVHHLFAAKGTNLADITVVYSHTQALGQCRGF